MKMFRILFLVGCAVTMLASSGCKSRGGSDNGFGLVDVGGAGDWADYGMGVDEEGRLIDSMGNLVVDSLGNPVYATDVTVDADGNLLGPDGQLLRDSNGQLISQIDEMMSGRQEDMMFLDTQFAPVMFPYDSNQIIASERSRIEQVAEHMRSNSRVSVVVEGHADERGSRDYNLALGERRALAVRAYLVGLGIEAGRIQTNSYGEEKPSSQGHDEGSWRLNRRAEFIFFN